MDVWKKYEGRKIFVILKNQRKYSGTCIEAADAGGNLVLFTINDKFGNNVSFWISEVEVIQMEGEVKSAAK